mmetsp:Transcript_3643/g.3985  ORF Transcript_3643/g.3985 Transcript_3643/m.3985 type:complete len:115 (+) Transcript_3643:503-847(+)
MEAGFHGTIFLGQLISFSNDTSSMLDIKAKLKVDRRHFRCLSLFLIIRNGLYCDKKNPFFAINCLSNLLVVACQLLNTKEIFFVRLTGPVSPITCDNEIAEKNRNQNTGFSIKR